MLRKLALIALVPAFIAVGPALAITAKEKKETCEIGAKDQNLEGKKAAEFIRKCMGKGNYEPQARKDLMKKTKHVKKPATKKKVVKKPAVTKPAPTQQKQQ